MNVSLGDRVFPFVLTLLLLGGCADRGEVRVSALPEKVGAEMHFRGFVTDEDEELVSEIHNFSKHVSRRDTIDGHPVFVYFIKQADNLPGSPEVYFYTDDDGTVWEKNVTDIGARLVAYGFSYREPVEVRRWEILLKVDDGVGTEWESKVDTVFNAITMAGETQKIRYTKIGKARYEGWAETFLPEPYKNIDVLDAYWYDLRTYLINETTSDTLFATEGIAHQYFTPEWGSVKYITNFTQTEKGSEPRPLRGTWELMRKQIPE